MNIERLEDGGITVLRVSGELAGAGAPELRCALRAVVGEGRARVVLNVAAVTALGYGGQGALLDGLDLCRAAGGDLRLAGARLVFQRRLRMCGVQGYFRSYDTEPEAIRAFKGEG